MVTSTQTRIVERVEHPLLTNFNHEFGTHSDLSRYDKIPSSDRLTTAEAFFINQLQMDSFIPTRIALLLKSNLHDLPFITHTTRSILYELKQNGKIGNDCFNFLHEKVGAEEFSTVFKYLYVIMLYTQIAKEHDDKTTHPGFMFTTAACYSDKLAKTPLFFVEKEELSLQQQLRKNYLKNWLLPFISNPNSLPQIQQHASVCVKLLETGLFAPLELQRFRISYLKLLETLQKSPELEKLCYQELRSNISSLQGVDFFNQLYLQLKTEGYYKNSLSRLVDLRQSLENTSSPDLLTLSEKCKKAYNGCIYLLGDHKNMTACSPIRFAALTGKVRSEWQGINHAFNRAQANFSHTLCACQAQLPPAQNVLANWPFTPHTLINLKPIPTVPSRIAPVDFEENQKKTVAVIGCKWGGGHMEVSRGIANNLSSLGYHSVTVDLPEVLISEDPGYRLLGENWTIASIFEGLLKKKAFAFINFLRYINAKFFSSKGYSETQVKHVLEHLLKINPDSVVTTYTAHNETIIEACRILGIPCIHVATDVDNTIETRTTPSSFEHFKMSIPFNAPESINVILKTTTAEQRFISGPPVRHAFTQKRTQSDIVRFKEKWGIDTNKKVVVISNGKNGSLSPYAEMLAKKYRNSNPKEIPIHLVVICGATHQNYKQHLEQKVIPTTKLPMTVGLSFNEEQMEELISMASYGGAIVGKAGGATIFETFAKGTRILVDNVSSSWFSQGPFHFIISVFDTLLQKCGFAKQLRWEKANLDFAKKHGLAQSFHQEKDFLPMLEKMITNDGKPIPLAIEVKNVEEEIPKMLRLMMIKAKYARKAQNARQIHQNL